MKNSRSDSKARLKVGKFLRARRQVLDLTMAKVAMKTGVLSLCQMAIFKIEKGIKGVRLCDVLPLSMGYGVEVKKLLEITGYSQEELDSYLKSVPPTPEVLGRINLDRPVTTDDLKYLISVSDGLKTPLNLSQVIQLLGLRY